MHAHCNCMAGFGECCTHIASLLWAIESAVRSRDSLTVTQESILGYANRCKRGTICSCKNTKFQGKKASKADLTKTHPGPSSSSNCSFIHGLSPSPSKCVFVLTVVMK